MQKKYINRKKYPANVPLTLLWFFRDHDFNYSQTAQALGINKGVVWNLINKGIEPHEFEIRQKLGLEKPDWLIKATDFLVERQKIMLNKEKRLI